MTAIAEGIPGQVLLVVALGVVERAGVQDLGGDAAVSRGREGLLVRIARCRRLLGLRLGVRVDARTVLRTHVVALTHPLGGVVGLPEGVEECVVADAFRIEDHEDDLVVAGTPAAYLLVGRVGGRAGRIADRGDVYPRQAPERLLPAPEAAEAELRERHALGEGRLDAAAVDEVDVGGGDRIRPPRQRLAGARDLRHPAERVHGIRLAGKGGESYTWNRLLQGDSRRAGHSPASGLTPPPPPRLALTSAPRTRLRPRPSAW